MTGCYCRPWKGLQCSIFCCATALLSTAPARRDGAPMSASATVASSPSARVDEPANRTIDCEGLVVAPGFVDIHTHYDAQLLWDPLATPSPLHGVIDRDRRQLRVHHRPARRRRRRLRDADDGARRGHAARHRCEAGPAWDWRTFGEWLDRLDGRVGINAGFLVGPLDDPPRRDGRRARAMQPRPPNTSRRWCAWCTSRCAAGALGFSSSLGEAHTDGDGNPVPSRASTHRRVHRAGRGRARPRRAPRSSSSRQWARSPTSRIELMTDMSLAANRPLNWNLLGSLSPTPVFEQQLVVV